MLLQAAPRFFAHLRGITAIPDESDELTGKSEIALRLDPDREQVGAQSMCQPPRVADDLAGMRPGIEAYQHAFSGRSHFSNPMLGHVLLELFFRLLGGAPQRQFAQRRQVPLAEEIIQCRLDAVGRIDVAMPHALAQGIGRDIDQLHLVGLVQDPVGQRLAHAHTGDTRHQVVQALQVLDIERGDHVDACIQDLLDILVALDMPGAWNVGVGQFIDQHHFGMPRNNGLGIHLFERYPAVGDFLTRNHLQIPQLRLRLGPTVRLHVAHHHVGTPALAAVPLVQHRIGLPRSGSRGQVDAQPAAPVWVAPGCRLRCDPGAGPWRGRCCRRSFQVAVAQAIAAQELLGIRTPLLAFTLFFVGRLLSHHIPIFSFRAPTMLCIKLALRGAG